MFSIPYNLKKIEQTPPTTVIMQTVFLHENQSLMFSFAFHYTDTMFLSPKD